MRGQNSDPSRSPDQSIRSPSLSFPPSAYSKSNGLSNSPDRLRNSPYSFSIDRWHRRSIVASEAFATRRVLSPSEERRGPEFYDRIARPRGSCPLLRRRAKDEALDCRLVA